MFYWPGVNVVCGKEKKSEEGGEEKGREMGDKCVCKTSQRVHALGIKSRHQMKLERPKIQIRLWIQAIQAQFKQKAFVDCNKMSLNCRIESIRLSHAFWPVTRSVFALNFLAFLILICYIIFCIWLLSLKMFFEVHPRCSVCQRVLYCWWITVPCLDTPRCLSIHQLPSTCFFSTCWLIQLRTLAYVQVCMWTSVFLPLGEDA